MFEALRLKYQDGQKKTSMVAELAALLGSQAHLAAVEKRLSPQQWQTLAHPRLAEGPLSLSSLRVRLQAQGLSEGDALAQLEALIAFGCLILVELPGGTYKADPTAANLAKPEYAVLKVVALPVFLEVAKRVASGEDPIGWVAGQPARVRSSSFADFQRELYLVLGAAAAGEIRYTAKGLPHRTDAAKLATLLQGQGRAKPGAKLGAQSGARPAAAKANGDTDLGSRHWFLLALLGSAGLARVVDGRLVPTPAGQAYLKAPAAEQARQLGDGWLDCSFSEFLRVPTFDFSYACDTELAWVDPRAEQDPRSDVPLLARLKAARRAIVQAIGRGAANRPGEWLALQALITSLQADDPEFLVPARRGAAYAYYALDRATSPRGRPYEGIHRKDKGFPDNLFYRETHWDEVEGAYVAQVLRESLYWLGLVDLGETAKGELVSFRLTSAGRAALFGEALPPAARSAVGTPPLIVQPNFEIVVLDASGHLDLLSQLDGFAERVTLDRAATYRLTRDALVRGLQRGLSGDAIISLLEDAFRAPLPQNVRYSLEEWVRVFERVHLRSKATLLVADSPGQLERWQRDAELAPLLGRRLSGTAVLVASQHRSQLAAALTKRGEAPASVDYAQPARGLLNLVEPTLIELVPKRDEPYVRYRLARFADPAPDGRPGRFRLTPESVRRGVADGLGADQILDYLSGAAAGPLPPDLRLRVRGWAGVIAPVGAQPVVAALTPEGLDWRELAAVPVVREALLWLVGGRLALIEPERFEAVRAALAERGVQIEAGLPRGNVTLGAAALPSLPAAGGLAGLVGGIQQALESLTRGLLAKRPDELGAADLALLRSLTERLTPAFGLPSDDLEMDGEGEETTDIAPGDYERGDRSVSLQVLPPRELRSFLRRAASEERRIYVGVEAPDGTRVALPLEAQEVWQDGPDWYLDAYCDNCEEVHTIGLDEITGVGDAPEPAESS